MRQFYINGVASSQFAIYCTSDTFLNSPEYAYEAYDVPSVNGALLKNDKHLNNVLRRFDCYCKDYPQNNLDAFKKMLYSNSGYMRIESDYDPDTYQMGYLAEGIEFEPFDADGNFTVHFSVTFSCKPQKWLKASTTSTADGVRYGNIKTILNKNSAEFQKIASLIPITALPQADNYVFSQITTFASGTNVSLATNTGDPIYLLQGTIRASDFTPIVRALVAYSLSGSIDEEVTYSTLQGSTFWYVVPLSSGINADNPLTVTWTVTTTAQTTTTITNYIGRDGTVSQSHSKAVGASPVIGLEYKFYDQNSGVLNPYYLRMVGLLNGVQTKDALFVFDTSLIPETTINYLVKNYGHEVSGYTGDVFLDVEYDAESESIYAVNGSNKYSLDDFVKIYGNTEGMCDTLSVTSFTISNGSYARKMSLTPRWWKV